MVALAVFKLSLLTLMLIAELGPGDCSSTRIFNTKPAINTADFTQTTQPPMPIPKQPMPFKPRIVFTPPPARSVRPTVKPKA
ncbi:hypothetical protein CHUAL_001840 [Chamberlinius hualienensis]